MPAAVIGLQEGVDVDHGQAVVVQDPVVEVCVPVVHGIGRANVDAAVGPALVGQTHHALRRNGAVGPVLPRLSRVFRTEDLVPGLGPCQHTPQTVGIRAVDVEVHRLVVVAAILRHVGGGDFPRGPTIGGPVNAPQRTVHLVRNVDAVPVAGADFHRNDFVSLKVVHQHPGRPTIFGTPEL